MTISSFLHEHPVLRKALAVPRMIYRTLNTQNERQISLLQDRLGTQIVEDVTVRVEEFGGDFALSPRSDLFRRIVARGYYEPGLAGLFFSYVDPDRDVIDVGANIGFYAVSAARKLKTGRVLAAEPVKAAFARLEANTRRNGASDRVILYNGLVGSTSGSGTIHSIKGLEEYSSVNRVEHPRVRDLPFEEETVCTKRLDDLVREYDLKPALIKVDVEGAEPQVFAGAAHTLATFRPVVISELSNKLLKATGANGRDIVKMFEDLDYQVSDPLEPKVQPGTRDFGDILCIPREMANASPGAGIAIESISGVTTGRSGDMPLRAAATLRNRND